MKLHWLKQAKLFQKPIPGCSKGPAIWGFEKVRQFISSFLPFMQPGLGALCCCVFFAAQKKTLMAYKNKIIYNPVNKHEMKFLQTAADTGGQWLEIEATYHAASKPPAPHYHPVQDEDFTVLEGSLLVQLDGQTKKLNAGDRMHIPRNTVHAMWNPASTKAVVNWQVRPALSTEYFLETGTGLAADGKVNARGMPPLLQVALLANKFSSVFRLSKPPFAVQKILFSLLTPFAYLKGYRSTYKKYLN